MAIWEYMRKVIKENGFIEALNLLGADGWEIITIENLFVDHGGTDYGEEFKILFKKDISDN